MRRLLLILSFLPLITVSTAQKYEPNTRWPYLYQDFTAGTIYFDNNTKSASSLNIHLLGNVLHYVAPDGRIFESTDKDIIRVEIGKDAYIYSDHKLVKIISSKGNNLLVLLTKADFDALRSGGSGAYGSSLQSSAAKDLSSLDLGGLNQPELGKLLQEKGDGRELSTANIYYFIIDGKQIDATRKGVDSFLPADKADSFNKFLKEKKVKWKKEEGLVQVLEFISEQ